MLNKTHETLEGAMDARLREIENAMMGQAPCGLDNIAERDLRDGIREHLEQPYGKGDELFEEHVFVALSDGYWDRCANMGDPFVVWMSLEDANAVLGHLEGGRVMD